MPHRKRDRSFYIELIVVTAVTLSIANVWVYIIKRFINSFFPNSFLYETLSAVIITFMGIFLLHKIFGDFDTHPIKCISSSAMKLPHEIDDDFKDKKIKID